MILSTEEKINWIRLILSENVGPITFNQLLSFYGTATEAIKHIDDLARRGGRKKPIIAATVDQAEKQLEQAEKNGVQLMFFREANYPKLLKRTIDAPPILFVKGQVSALDKPAVSIVGTRNASLNGKGLAKRFGRELAEQGYNVVSGMARGIDRSAHQGALTAVEDRPATTAVLGTAVDEVYPDENKDIYTEISRYGCLVSEFPFRTILSPRNFPRRNRIIAGLSLGTVVIEAQERSGSLITAREALNQGREVFAVPGSPVDPRSAGPNALIRDGAILVETSKDIIASLENLQTFSLSEPDMDMFFEPEPINDDIVSSARDTVVRNLGPEMVSVDRFVSETGLDVRLINIILVELELAGRLERYPGNRVSLIYSGE